MRIYISGPISKDKDYMAKFDKAKIFLEEEYPDAEIINPAEINSYMPTCFTHKDYMQVSFLLLSKCDYIFMLPGWRESCGASQEHGYAYAKDMVILNA